MEYIDIHAHMVSRTTNDYTAMAMAGCVAVSEPAFWMGWDRSTPEGFADYFRQLTEFEPQRAARAGIRHYCWVCLNPKESDNRDMTRAMLDMLPGFLSRPTVLGVGEIGLNKNTHRELASFREQAALAAAHHALILIHTPHLEDKLKGTHLIIQALLDTPGLDPQRVLIDHGEEHTLPLILEAGFWGGMTLYPVTKLSPERAADLAEQYSQARLVASSACDWGESDPLAVPRLAMEMRRRGHSEALLRRLMFENPARFLSGSPHFHLDARGVPRETAAAGTR